MSKSRNTASASASIDDDEVSKKCYADIITDEGFDVQTCGYGLMATYHAKNEYCLLPDMCQGYQVFTGIIAQLEE